MLLHEKSLTKRNEQGHLEVHKVDPGKIHFKEGGFSETEWTEIKNIIANYQNNQEEKPTNDWDWKTPVMYLGIGVIILIAIWLFWKLVIAKKN